MLRLLQALDQDDASGSLRKLVNRLSHAHASMLTAPEAGLLFHYGLVNKDDEIRGLMMTHAIFRAKKRAAPLERFIAYEHLNDYPPRIYGRNDPWPPRK